MTPEALALGLVDRLRTLLLALDRQDRLETAGAFVGWLEAERHGTGLGTAARELLLRALRRAGDPVNFDILRRLDPLEPVEIPDLMKATGLDRVALSERVHDLVQTGLAVRELVNDQIRGTDLAGTVVALVESAAAEAGKLLAADLDRRAGGAA